MSHLSIPQTFNYSPPGKRINDSRDLQLFQTSLPLKELQETLYAISQLVQFKPTPKGVIKPLHDRNDISKSLDGPDVIRDESADQLIHILDSKPWVRSLTSILRQLSDLIDETPPMEGPRRFGNLARRTWQQKIDTQIDSILSEAILPYYKYPNPEGFISELKWYLLNAFGSPERLDYGTGHELNFLAFLTLLWKVNVIPNPQIAQDSSVSGEDFLIIFGEYYNVVKKLILTYTLEPAGSHGVWGLDDHFHILYILGASQLTNPETIPTKKIDIIEDSISPKLILNKSYIIQNSDANLFFSGIELIYKVKPKGNFFEHSPILYDISTMKNWGKIGRGLVKMFVAEVLGKFPVVQHFWFGGVLMPWKDTHGKDLPIRLASADDIKESGHGPQVNIGFNPATVTPFVSQQYMKPITTHHSHLENRSFSRSHVPQHRPQQSTVKTRSGTAEFMVPTKAPWAK